jgi:hypothetical protein
MASSLVCRPKSHRLLLERPNLLLCHLKLLGGWYVPSQTVAAAAIASLQAAVPTLEDVAWQPVVALLALMTSSNPPPEVIGTFMVLENLLSDLRMIHLSPSLGIAGGNHVLAG